VIIPAYRQAGVVNAYSGFIIKLQISD